MEDRPISIQPADRLSLVQEYYFSRKLKEVARLNAEGRDIINPNPPKEWNMDRQSQQQIEMLKSIPPNLNYYYKEKVNQYFYNIE